MKRFSILMLLFCTGSTFAQFELESVTVTGDKEAYLQFKGQGTIPVPSQKVQDGTIELTFQGGEISDNANGKLDLEGPHVLIRRVSVYAPEKGIVKAKIVVNGTSDSLKDRFSYSRNDNGIQAMIAYPKAESTALTLLKEEQEPIKDLNISPKTETSKTPYLQFIIAVCVVLLAGAGFIFWTVKTLKKKGLITGSRKYLIESLAHASLGQKAGVSLLRIGKEFVLVGVTSEQVTFLSNLPRLQEQYEEETRFERGVFREAVQEEVDRLRVANA